MVGIRNSVGISAQQPKKGNKVLKHAGNAVMTATALGATGVGTYALMKSLAENATNFSRLQYSSLQPKKTLGTDFYKFMTKIGNKLFPAGGDLHKYFEKVAKYATTFSPCDTKFGTNAVKGGVALLLTAGVTSLAILGASLYKAGKINGEG